MYNTRQSADIRSQSCVEQDRKGEASQQPGLASNLNATVLDHRTYQNRSFLRIVLIRITILYATKTLVAHQDTGVRSIAEFRKLDLSCIESIALGKNEYH